MVPVSRALGASTGEFGVSTSGSGVWAASAICAPKSTLKKMASVSVEMRFMCAWLIVWSLFSRLRNITL